MYGAWDLYIVVGAWDLYIVVGAWDLYIVVGGVDFIREGIFLYRDVEFCILLYGAICAGRCLGAESYVERVVGVWMIY
jgi:glucose dehydrogenase